MQDFQLGQWRVSPAHNSLQQDQQQRSIEHTPMQVLLYLVQHHDRPVSKDELLETIWAGKVVSEDALTVAISQLRKALGDSARQPDYIKTLPGKGYQLIAPVTLPPPLTTEDNPTRKKYPMPVWFLAVFAIALAGILGWYATLNTSTSSVVYPPQAADAYQQGRYLLSQNGADKARQAETLFNRARELAPDMGEAHWGMAEARLRQPDAAQDQVENWLQQAIRLAPEFAPAHLTLAQYYFTRSWQFEAAGRTFQQALKLDPKHSQSHFLYAQFLLARGQFDSALQHTREYMRLAPQNYAAPVVAWIYNMMGKYQLALDELNKIANLSEPQLSYHISIQAVLENMGREEESFRHLREIMQQRGFSQRQLTSATARFQQGGLQAVYQWLLENNYDQNIGQYAPPLSQARYATKAGKLQLALDKLHQAVEQKQTEVLWLAVDPAYAPLHPLPEYQQLLKQIGILTN
ncbi:winged helix-turn-helix domain-containing protein [Lacimicrobium alkaliphilum]|nr:winged helix-turn-helix domain-containing protein [Lacimicrobium alkaliphilum]